MPLRLQFASGRPTTAPPTIAAVSGGSLSAGSLWIGLQKRNRVGYNRPSSLTQVSFANGEKIQITIPSTARIAGEDWREYVLVGYSSSNPVQAVKLAAIPGYSAGLPITLPTTIELSRPAHVALAPNVANAAALPSGSDLIRGMIRGIVATGFYYTYEPASTATPDGLSVIAGNPSGRWLRSALPVTYVLDTRSPGGCDILAVSAPPEIAQTYPVDGTEGEKFAYWIVNDNAIGGAPIPQGSRVNLSFSQDGISVSEGLSGKMGIIFDGHWDTSLGQLDDAMTGAGGASTYYAGADGAFTLQQDLEPGQAWAFQVFPRVGWYELESLSPDGALVSVSAKVYQDSGVPTEVGFLLGDVITSEGEKGRIYPGFGLTAVVGSRSGIVANHAFNKKGTSIVPGLTANTADQVIVVDHNGNCYKPLGAIPISARKRAIVGTLLGSSGPCAYSATATLASPGTLAVTCNHPVNVAGKGVIRSDYPDRIAGEAIGEFNPPQLSIYVQRVSNSEIRKFPGNAVLNADSQVINLANWTSAPVVGSLPTAPTASFSLYAPESASAVATVGGGGSFPADSYRVCFAYDYDGNQATSISHPESDPSYIYEIGESLAELFAHAQDFANPHRTGFRIFTGATSGVSPAFATEIWVATDTGVIYRATGTTAGALVAVGANSGGFVSRLITTLVFS